MDWMMIHECSFKGCTRINIKGGDLAKAVCACSGSRCIGSRRMMWYMMDMGIYWRKSERDYAVLH